MKIKAMACAMLAALFAMGCGGGARHVPRGIDHEDHGGKPWVVDIEDLTLNNTNFRTVKWTGTHLQLVVMSIEVGGEIGLEAHPKNDQFIRVERGTGRVMMGPSPDDLSFVEEVSDDWSILVPAGWFHNLVNTGDEPLMVYTVYGPPEHPRGTVHADLAAAAADEHHHPGEVHDEGDAAERGEVDDSAAAPDEE